MISMKSVVIAYRVDDSMLVGTPLDDFVGCTTARSLTRYFDDFSFPLPSSLQARCEAVSVVDYGSDFVFVSGGVVDGQDA